MNIAVPMLSVYEKLKNINNWDQWNEYIKALPDKRISSDSISSLHLTVCITRSDSSFIESVWRQRNGTTFRGVYHLFPADSVTIVQWYFEFTFKWYPWEKLSSIVYDQQLSPQMEQSLLNLKLSLEKAE